MFGLSFNPFSTSSRTNRVKPAASRRNRKAESLCLEELESRLVPSSAPLGVAGAQLVDFNGNTVVLRGVNISGLESYPTGLTGDKAQVLRSVDVALNDWHANLIRLTVYPDFWFGRNQGVGLDNGDPTTYRSLIDQVVAKASAHDAYVMLTVWGTDMGDPTLRPDLHDLPDDGTQAFWQDAATHMMLVNDQGNPIPNGPSYANNPTVMFDLFNEPHNNSGQVGWNEWYNGGYVTETSQEGETLTYHSPGMKGLLDTVRAAGASNVVVAEGLGYSSDLSGIAAGYALKDPINNVMYSLHLYPAQWQSAADGDALVPPLVRQYPIYVGEFGTPRDANDPAANVNGVPSPDAATWTQNMLTWLDQHQYSWTAWSLSPNTPPSLISDWDYTPTNYFGSIVKDNLTNHAANAAATSVALTSLQTALQNATVEFSYALVTNSPGLAFAEASYVDSLMAYTLAQSAANTQSAADWATAEQYAWAAQSMAFADFLTGNNYALDAYAWDLNGYALAQAVTTPETK
jgi:hypothetical protein